MESSDSQKRDKERLLMWHRFFSCIYRLHDAKRRKKRKEKKKQQPCLLLCHAWTYMQFVWHRIKLVPVFLYKFFVLFFDFVLQSSALISKRGWPSWPRSAAETGKEPWRYSDHLRSSGSPSRWIWASLSDVKSDQEKMPPLSMREPLLCNSMPLLALLLLEWLPSQYWTPCITDFVPPIEGVADMNEPVLQFSSCCCCCWLLNQRNALGADWLWFMSSRGGR